MRCQVLRRGQSRAVREGAGPLGVQRESGEAFLSPGGRSEPPTEASGAGKQPHLQAAQESPSAHGPQGPAKGFPPSSRETVLRTVTLAALSGWEASFQGVCTCAPGSPSPSAGDPAVPAPSQPLACLPMALDTARVPLTLQQSMCDTKPPRASMRSFSSCGDSQGGRGAGGRAVGLGVSTPPEGRPAGFQGSTGDRAAVRRD